MCKHILLLLSVLTLHGMEEEVVMDIGPSMSPELIVSYLSTHMFNRESDSQFEKLFLSILRDKKQPKLYPDLKEMREHIEREIQYRIRG